MKTIPAVNDTLREQKRILCGRGYELSASFKYRCPNPGLDPHKTESFADVEWERSWHVMLYELRVGPLDELLLLQPEDLDYFTGKRLDDLVRDKAPCLLLLPDSDAEQADTDVVHLYIRHDLLPRGSHMKLP